MCQGLHYLSMEVGGEAFRPQNRSNPSVPERKPRSALVLLPVKFSARRAGSCTATCPILRVPRRSVYYYLSNSPRAAPVLCGQAGSLRPIAGALRARPGERSSPVRETIRPPGSPEYPARLGSGSAALRGRFSTCGRFSIGPMPALYKLPTGGLQTRRKLKTCPTSHQRIHLHVARNRPIPESANRTAGREAGLPPGGGVEAHGAAREMVCALGRSSHSRGFGGQRRACLRKSQPGSGVWMRAGAGTVSVAVVLHSLAMCQVVDSGFPENFQHGALGVGPNRVGRTRTPSHAGLFRGEAEVQANRTLDGFHHIQKRHLLPRHRQFKPSGISPVDTTRPARVKLCKTFERNCSGHSAASAKPARLARVVRRLPG